MDYDKYTVIDEKKLSDYHGTYRVILYDTGFYALQLKDEDEVDVFNTIFVCPIKDTFISEDYNMPFGELIMNSLLESLEESDKLYNGEYWTLSLTLDDDTNFMEVITKGRGESLIGQLEELILLEQEQLNVYNRAYPLFVVLQGLFYIVCIICLCFVVYSIISGL